jgi:hypothetical protein
MADAAAMEDELQEQLAEQRAAMDGIVALIAAGGEPKELEPLEEVRPPHRQLSPHVHACGLSAGLGYVRTGRASGEPVNCPHGRLQPQPARRVSAHAQHLLIRKQHIYCALWPGVGGRWPGS